MRKINKFSQGNGDDKTWQTWLSDATGGDQNKQWNLMHTVRDLRERVSHFNLLQS